MAIDFQTPTISPPAATDVVGLDSPASQSAQQAVATPPSGSIHTTNQTQGFVSDWMSNPSRYDIPLVQQGTELINEQFEQGVDRGMELLDERMSQRGLVGSSVEARATGDLIAQLNQQRASSLFDLNRDMAATQAADRSSAASAATALEQLQQSDSQFDRQLAFSYDQLAEQTGISQEQLALQRDEMVNVYGGTLANGTTVAGENAEARAHQLGMQANSQEFQSLQNDLSRALEREALALQQAGLDAETAWRTADREQRAMLESRALDLQEYGLDQEQAYRAAALEIQTELAREEQALQAYQSQLSAWNSQNIARMGAMASIIESLNRFAAANSDVPFGENYVINPTIPDTYFMNIAPQPTLPAAGEGVETGDLGNWMDFLSMYRSMMGG